MPKIGQARCLDSAAHSSGIESLLAEIARLSGKSRGDVVIAFYEDISVYAVRAWLKRPIPRKHWATLARLPGYSVERIQEIARGYFINAGS
jgi:hypothetical protein